MNLELLTHLRCLYIFLMVEDFSHFMTNKYSDAPSVTLAVISFHALWTWNIANDWLSLLKGHYKVKNFLEMRKEISLLKLEIHTAIFPESFHISNPFFTTLKLWQNWGNDVPTLLGDCVSGVKIDTLTWPGKGGGWGWLYKLCPDIWGDKAIVYFLTHSIIELANSSLAFVK